MHLLVLLRFSETDSFIHSIFYLTYLFNKYSLRTYYMLCFQLVTEGDTNEKKLQGLTVRSGGSRTANKLLLL